MEVVPTIPKFFYFGELLLKPVLTTTVTQLPLLDPTTNYKYPAMTTQEQISKPCDPINWKNLQMLALANTATEDIRRSHSTIR